jgi:hypothetical protein
LRSIEEKTAIDKFGNELNFEGRSWNKKLVIRAREETIIMMWPCRKNEYKNDNNKGISIKI